MAEAAAGDSPKFDFITDVGFRTSLESDYRELQRCLDNGAWKAVHVLAGSVVEAILTDYLIGVGYDKKSGKKPLEMELGPIISACKSEKIITERTADLSSVVRSYRNLIHPGRVIRLKEKVDNKTAAIAKALVDVVADEVAAARAVSYGFTAEQIANKIEKDPSALAVLAHFLKKTNERERERLVADVLPGRFFFAREFGDETSSSDYGNCYRQAFDTLSEGSKIDATKRFVRILEEEAGDYVLAYENLFFRASDLGHLDQNDAAMVKAHLLSRLEKEQSVALLNVLEGFGPFLREGEIGRVVSAYAKIIVHGKSQSLIASASYLLYMLHDETADEVQKQLGERLDTWISLAERRGMNEQKDALEGIKSSWTSEIPL
ncbi:MAG: hypothetical protein WCF68_07680 [Terriglobales bacterium]